MNKVQAPANHRRIFKKIYSWLHETLEVKAAEAPLPGLAQSMLTLYRSKPRKITGEADTQSIRSGVKSCSECKLGKRTQRRFVDFGFYAAEGSARRRVMAVTDIPEIYDETQGRLLNASAGELAMKILEAAGLKPGEIWITSAVKCASPRMIDDLIGIKICRKYLEAEVKAISPGFIIAFGELSYRMMAQNTDFENQRGRLTEFNNAPCLYLRHPRDLQHDSALKKEAWEDLKPHLHAIQKAAMQTI